MNNVETKARPQTLCSQLLEANTKNILEAYQDKKAPISRLKETAKASFFVHQLAAGEAKKRKYAGTVAGTKTDFYDRKIPVSPEHPTPRQQKRQARKSTLTEGLPACTVELLENNNLTTLDSILIKGTERVDVELLWEIKGFGQSKIDELKIVAAKLLTVS